MTINLMFLCVINPILVYVLDMNRANWIHVQTHSYECLVVSLSSEEEEGKKNELRENKR